MQFCVFMLSCPQKSSLEICKYILLPRIGHFLSISELKLAWAESLYKCTEQQQLPPGCFLTFSFYGGKKKSVWKWDTAACQIQMMQQQSMRLFERINFWGWRLFWTGPIGLLLIKQTTEKSKFETILRFLIKACWRAVSSEGVKNISEHLVFQQ